MTKHPPPKPPEIHGMEAICRMTMSSPIGTLVLEGTDRALTRLELPGSRVRADLTVPGDVRVRGDVSGDVEVAGRALSNAVLQLQEYFAGDRKEFDIALEVDGTPFQHDVWLALAEIPYGQTVSYAELAEMVGRPKAFRAVGQANGSNPVPIVLPCHRVVASGGHIGGYGGGIATKRRLLELEGASWTD
jgi:methylated-DNA-[protein]-cysteine S-methyltransferase